jgi:acyl carrier protein
VPTWPAEFEELVRPHCRFVPADSPVDPDTGFALLGLDSLAMLTLIAEVEDRFGVMIPDTVMVGQEFDTPASMWRSVSRLLTRSGEDTMLDGDRRD